MACSNCNTSNCGCSGTYVVSQTCPPACSEVFNSACIVYTGVDIICNDTTVSPAVPTTIVRRNDYLDTALTAIVNYVCSRFNTQIHPTTVVDSGDAFILVSSNVVGAETTYTVSLDPTNLPQASEVTGGVNVTVTGDGTPTTDPYVVNAQGSIVAVAPGTALSVIADADTPGPFDTTYTIDIDYDQLPDVSLITSQGYISITEQAGVPNAGDTQYTLDVDQVTVETSDNKLAVALTAPGGAPNFLRTFDVTVDDTIMAEFIMDTLNQAGPGLIGLQEGAGIGLLYDSVNHVMTISSTFTDPLKWLTLEDFAATSIDATTTTSTIVLSADASSGLTAVLGGDGNTATYTLENVDKGSDQLIFGSVDCNNGGPSVGTCTPSTNTDALTIIGGDDITLGVAGNTITINNDIDNVYSDVIADSGGSLQAATTTATLELLGGTGISTVGAAGPTNSVTIENDGVLTVSAGSNIIVDNADPQNPIVSTRANAIVDDATVTSQDIDFAAVLPTALTHTVGTQYVQIRVIANTVIAGTINGIAIVADQDITSDFAIVMGSSNNYTLKATTFNGNVRVIVIGTI